MKRLLIMITLVLVLSLVHVSTAQGESLPDSAYITGFVGHAQSYAISCESRSAVDWAAYWGVSIGETEFLESLPRADNPEQGFVGDPNEVWGRIPPDGYGVHAGPVAATLRDFGLDARAAQHLTWDDLRAEIAGNRPVIVWIIGAMWDGTPLEYTAPDGSTSIVAYYEHTMTLVGYGPDSVQVVDSYSGQYQNYKLNTFLDSWAVLGNMAVLGSNQAPGEVEPAALGATGARDAGSGTNAGSDSGAGSDRDPAGDTYTVQPGDYLIALARRFGITWQELADLNSIGLPFAIYPGQVLHLPAQPQAAVTHEDPSLDRKPLTYQMHLPLVVLNNASPGNHIDLTDSLVRVLRHTFIFLPLGMH